MERLENPLTTKQSWQELTPAQIAALFSFACDENFQQALKAFIEEVVKDAKVTHFLPSLAQNYFNKWRPPLTKDQ